MDCGEYIKSHLAADADGELTAAERVLADEHLAGCAGCRVRLAEERALKALLRQRLRREVPRGLQDAIRSRLDSADAAFAPPGRLASIAAEARRPQFWAPLIALAASLVFVVATRDQIAHQAPIPQFDVAIQRYVSFEKHFEPNVPSDSAATVSDDYFHHHMPAFLWNFSPFGFELVGGRRDALPDGRPATYTLYRGPRGTVMCTRFQMAEITIPPGGRELQIDQYLYRYKGISLVFSVDYQRHWVCILMSRQLPEEFADEVSSLEG